MKKRAISIIDGHFFASFFALYYLSIGGAGGSGSFTSILDRSLSLNAAL